MLIDNTGIEAGAWASDKVGIIDEGTIYYTSHQVRADSVHYIEDSLDRSQSLTQMHIQPYGEEHIDFVSTEPLINKWLDALGADSAWSESPVVTDALMTEIAPWWEQDAVYSYIAHEYLTEDEIRSVTMEMVEDSYWDYDLGKTVYVEYEMATGATGVAQDYYEKGPDAVQDELSPFFDKPDVQAAFAESALYLSLTQDQRWDYGQMEREDQYEMLFVDDYDTYMASNKAFNLLNLSMWDLEVKQHVEIDLADIGDRLSKAGIDGYEWFREEFEAETTVMRYEGVQAVVDPIARLYYGVLGRTPEKDGFEYWIEKSNDGAVLQDMAADFAWSKEFLGDVDLNVGPTAEQLVIALYENVLDRAPDGEGYEWWLDKAELAIEHDLRGGTVPGTTDITLISGEDEVFTFGRIVTGFTESEEFVDSMVADVYAIEVAHWGVNLEDLIDADLGFEPVDLVGIEVSQADFFLI